MCVRFLLFLIFSTSLLASEKNVFEGKLEYPESYRIRVYPIETNLPKKKHYVAGVIQAITIDNLKILKKVYVPAAEPIQIDYPYPALTVQGKEIEDPSGQWVASQLKKKPSYFDLTIEESPDRPFALNQLEKEKQNLRPQMYHLFLSVKPANKANEYTASFYLVWQSEVLFKQGFHFKEDDLVEGASQSSTALRKVLVGKNWGNLEVTSTPENVSVYLDDYFLGKTPLKLDYLPAGKHEISLRKETFASKNITTKIPRHEKLALNETIQPISGKGSIEIESFPAGAKVYLGVIYRGITPLKLKNVPFGIHRIRIAKDGFADRFQSVTIGQKQSDFSLRMQMTPGTNAEVYRIDPPILFGLTYRNMFYVSLGVAATSAAVGLYFLTQRDEQQELAAKRFNTSTGSVEDNSYISDRIGDANRNQNFATGFFVGSGVFIGGAIYFFVRFLQSQDLDISALPSKESDLLAYGNGAKPYLQFGTSPYSRPGAIGYDLKASWHF